MQSQIKNDQLSGTLVRSGQAYLLLIGGQKSGKSTLGWLMKDLGLSVTGDGTVYFDANGLYFSKQTDLVLHSPSLVPELNEDSTHQQIDNKTGNLFIHLPIESIPAGERVVPVMIVWMERTQLPVYSLLVAAQTEMAGLISGGDVSDQVRFLVKHTKLLYRLRIPADFIQFRRVAAHLSKELSAFNLLITATSQQGQS